MSPAALLGLLGLLLPRASWAQEATAGSGAPALPLLTTAEALEVRFPFFAHTPFGFDATTPAAFATETAARAAGLLEAVGRLPGLDGGALVALVAPWVALVVLIAAAVVADVRARRLGARIADLVAERIAHRHVGEIVLARAGVGATAAALVPIAVLGLLAIPVELAPTDARVALRDMAGYFGVYRVLRAILGEFLDGRFLTVEQDQARHLHRSATLMLRIVLGAALATRALDVLHYSDPVIALARTTFRGSMAVLSLTLLRLRGPIVALLPRDGSAAWIQIRAALERVLLWALLASTILLGVWTAGFEHAARTLLVRSWALIGLLVVGGLVRRSFDRRASELRAADKSLQASLLRQVDQFARSCMNAGFAVAVLALLGLLRPLTQLLDAVRITIGTTHVSLLNVTLALVTVALGVLLSRVLRAALSAFVYPWLEFDEGAEYAANTAVAYATVVVAGIAGLVQLGIDFSAIAVFAGALGVGIGFGLQDFAKNLLGGFVLLFGRSIEKGDLVSVGDQPPGYVQAITARAVRLVTRDNIELVIPTAQIISSPLTNWTHSDPMVRLHIPVGVTYEADPHVVREALIEAAGRFPDCASHLPADVWLVSFGDSSVNFELLIWIDARRITPEAAHGRVLFHVWDVLKERGIEIPFPQRDLHVKSVALPARVEAALSRLSAGEGKP